MADIDRTSDEDDYVLLMTLHSAKGLEFPVVYMAGMDDGIFPGYAVIYYGDHEDLEEERRLCYVGITRARQELTMISARRRFLKGKYEDYTPSRFIKEVPREVAELGDLPMPRVSQAQKLAAARQEGTAMNRIFQPYPGGESPGSGGRRTFSSSPGSIPAARPASNTPLKSLDYQEGDMVRHVKYGIGRVISIASGGRDFEVTVEFERFGVKKMFAGFARLVKV